MSDRHRRGSSGGKTKWKTWLGWGVVVALLGGNMVMALVNQKDETPQGFITPDLLQGVAFWIPIGTSMLLSVLGLYWSSKAYAHSERSSLLWARRGYVFSLAGAVALAIACFEPETFDRQWLAVLAGGIVGGQTVFFAMLSYKEYQRAETGEGSRRVRRNDPYAGKPIPPQTSIESTDTAQ